MIPTAYFRVCDEIRTERNGKSILIGQYSDSIVVQQFPTKIPRLTFLLTLRYDKSAPPKSVRFRITFPNGDEKLSKVINPGPSPKELLERQEISFAEARLNWRIGPIPLETDGLIKVVALVDDVEISAGVFGVRSGPNEGAVAPPPEFLMLIAMGARGTEDAKRAVFRFFDYLEPHLHQQGLDEFLDKLITTIQIDDRHIAAFTATPMQDWKQAKIQNIEESPKPNIMEHNPFYCVFEFPEGFRNLSEAVVTTDERAK